MNFRGISSPHAAIFLIYTFGLRNSLLYVFFIFLRFFKNIADRLLYLKRQKRSHLIVYELLQHMETDKMIIKPSMGSGRGKKIYLVNNIEGNIFKDNNQIKLYDLISEYPKGFILQKRLAQHKQLSEIYPYSLNTIRMVTLRFNGSIHLLSAILKLGNNYHFLAKTSMGGFSCGINKNGKCFNSCFDSSFISYKKHPQTNIPFEGRHVPGFDKLVDTVINLHRDLYYFDIISWDMAIDEYEQPVLIELNLRNQGITFHQAMFGPLFGEFSDAILQRVCKRSL